MLRLREGVKTMLNNINISGLGKVPSGEYNNINISGSGKILGDVKANIMDVSGSGKVLNNLEVNNICTSGYFKVFGDVKVNEKIACSGSFKCDKNIVANNLSICGSLKTLGNITFDLIELSGLIKVIGDCEGRKICGEGKVNVKGLLSADEIDLKLLGQSRANELGGENIRIIAGRTQSLKIFCFSYIQKIQLCCNIIEGDNIYLENTIAKVVRGKNITIGKDCVIEKIECSGELKIEEGSKVKEKIAV